MASKNSKPKKKAKSRKKKDKEILSRIGTLDEAEDAIRAINIMIDGINEASRLLQEVFEGLRRNVEMDFELYKKLEELRGELKNAEREYSGTEEGEDS